MFCQDCQDKKVPPVWTEGDESHMKSLLEAGIWFNFPGRVALVDLYSDQPLLHQSKHLFNDQARSPESNGSHAMRQHGK